MADVYESLQNWATGKIEGVADLEIRQSTVPMSGMGIFAKRDFKEGEVILKSAHPLCHITPELGMQKYGDLIKASLPTEKIVGFNDNLATLVLYLLLEKFDPESSDITPYLDALPSDLSHLPVFWSDEDLMELQGSSALTTIIVYRGLAKVIFEECVKKIQTNAGKLSKATQDDVSKALALVTSRSWAHRTLGFEMRPVLDMCNMQPTGLLPVQDEKGDWSLIAPKGGIAKGKEIFVSYGFKPHSDMLYLYGIHNPSWKECEQLKLHVNVQNPSSTVRYAVEQAPDGWNTAIITKEFLDPLLAIGRIVCFNHADLRDVERIKTSSIVNADNETRAVEHAINLLKYLVENKPTTLEADKDLLTTTDRLEKPHLWTAISVRRFEKEIALSATKWLENTLASMKKSTPTPQPATTPTTTASQ